MDLQQAVHVSRKFLRSVRMSHPSVHTGSRPLMNSLLPREWGKLRCVCEHLPRLASALASVPAAVAAAAAQGQKPEHITLRSLPVRQDCCSSLHWHREDREERSWNVWRGGQVGQEKKMTEWLLVIWMRHRVHIRADVCSFARSKLKSARGSIMKKDWVVSGGGWCHSNHVSHSSAAASSSSSDEPRETALNTLKLQLKHFEFLWSPVTGAEWNKNEPFETRCFRYLWGVVVSVRATHRWGCSHGTRLAAAFLDLQLSGLLDPASRTQRRRKSIHQANRKGSLFIISRGSTMGRQWTRQTRLQWSSVKVNTLRRGNIIIVHHFRAKHFEG